MNLAQAVEYDPDTRRHRVACELAPPGVGWMRPILGPTSYVAPTDGPGDGPCRRAMRAGGLEIINLLRAAGSLVPVRSIVRQLPHVHPCTLRWRLSHLTAREDIVRYGERGHYRYGLPGVSTLGTT